MGTEFEDENAKEKLKAMLNRQFGIGDVSSPFPCLWQIVCFLNLLSSPRLMVFSTQFHFVWRPVGVRLFSVLYWYTFPAYAGVVFMRVQSHGRD